jgi:hypothetical protein
VKIQKIARKIFSSFIMLFPAIPSDVDCILRK